MTREEAVHEIKIGDDWSVPNLNGVGRRTLVQGAVWTVPVIAAASAAPLAAASTTTDPELVFTNGPYDVTACGELDEIDLKLTAGGSADANKTVTVSLPSGLTWSDGSTGPRPFTTDQNGEFEVTGVRATSTTGSYTLIATSSTGASATSTVTVHPAGTAIQYNTATKRTAAYTSVPLGSTALGTGIYLAPNGELWLRNRLLATGVTSAAEENRANGDNIVSYSTATGSYNFNVSQNPNASQAPSVPAGSTTVGLNTFLAPNGDLYYGNGKIASNVTSAHTETVGNNPASTRVSYMDASGAHTYNTTNGNVTNFTQVPADAEAVGMGLFLTPSGALYFGDTVVKSSGVTSASIQRVGANSTDTRISYVDGTGAYGYNPTNGNTFPYVNVPAGSTAVGTATFLAPNGDLYKGDKLIAKNVSSAVEQYVPSSGTSVISYVSGGNC
ncbi:hypothetical protein SAMN06295885_0362 [Rathayibacter oskolensis]|uniref:Uncharacterized protein n=1 Tax=Rathayibacter oskolensis TaxID=1891671 RepID=A0A1X7MYG4_9MICO|nr:hypothetical protein [Rathayibacter oskolensis]SMH29914.1 hypothetical protein SAMN06295885_0362 [Rathayibacter oskolensis]